MIRFRGGPAPAERPEERLRAHWEIERELAERLRGATRDERTTLYGSVYDELFRRVPDHPQVLRRADRAEREASARRQAKLIRRFLAPGGVFLEIGAGDCALSVLMAGYAAQVYAVEVSREIASIEHPPPNFELVITDGRAVRVPRGTVDLAYSNQLMEHLHPEDAAEQVDQIFAALRSGGRYVCLTPNRLLGPADISMYFEDDVASGFHLREYSNRELGDLFAAAGFSSIKVIATLGDRVWELPLILWRVLELAFELLPGFVRRRLKRRRTVRKLLCPGGGVSARKG